jgi:hypothetical protein
MAPAHFLILALQCLLPIFERASGDYLGISIVNRDAQAREFTVTATPSSGVNPQSGRLTLNAGAQRASMLNQIIGGTVPSPGWIRLDPDANGCASYLASGNGEALASTDADDAAASVVVLPHISINTGFTELNHADASISIVNAGSSTASVTAQLTSLAGAAIGTVQLTVPSNGSFHGRVSDLFLAVLPDNSLGGKTLEGYLRLSSNTPISAFQRTDTPLSRTMLRGIPVPSEFSNTVIPHFVIGGNYESYVNIVNPGSGPTNVIELRAVDDTGNRIGETIQMTLRPGEGRRMTVGELFRIVTIQIFPPPIITGSIYIRQSPSSSPLSPMPQVIVSLEIVAGGNGAKSAAMLYPASNSPSVRWTVPFAASSPPYFTGYAIATANELLTVQTDVEVELINSNGEPVDRLSYSLSPGTRRTAMIRSGIPSGYLRITSNFPVFVMGSIGTNDLLALDQLPAVRQ